MSEHSAKEKKAGVFDCRMCGHCCEGKGGIVVSSRDLRRLCDHMGLSPVEFERSWGERWGDKLHIRCGEDGRCVFFEKGAGCSVHEAKPDICRAWPFFRGNLVDAESYMLARDFCPGISVTESHAAFRRQGLDYLLENNLAGSAGKDEAMALQIADLLRLDAKNTEGEDDA